ncbi:MAG: iron-containing redox enzyme family protein [Polyangiales bacterium]
MSDVPRSQRVLAKLDLAFPVFSASARRIWSSPQVRALYPMYLRTMHMVVRSAVPLMRAALHEATDRAGSDPLCAALVDYYTHHIKEETGHDGWLLDDLSATGVNPTAVLDSIPSSKVATLVGAQYYWLHHWHPVSLLGHITAIESYHPPAGFAEHLAQITGYPLTAFRAIARHAVLDVHHRRELIALLDSLPLSPQQEKMVVLSGLHTLEAGIDLLTEVADSVAPPVDATITEGA